MIEPCRDRSTANFPQGQSSRSLISAAIALADPELQGLPVKHLKGGLNAWFRDGFEGAQLCMHNLTIQGFLFGIAAPPEACWFAGEGSEAKWEDNSGRVPYVAGFTTEQDAEELL